MQQAVEPRPRRVLSALTWGAGIPANPKGWIKCQWANVRGRRPRQLSLQKSSSCPPHRLIDICTLAGYSFSNILTAQLEKAIHN